MAETSECPGCGLELPARDGPAHPYIGASAACWALYGDLLARQYEGFQSGLHRMTVDAYAVQHPGRPERRSIQSVNIHLVALCLTLERGVKSADARRLMQRMLSAEPEVEWLEPPRPNGTVTVREVLDGTATVEAWAHDVWGAWAAHHEAVRRLIDETLSPGSPGGAP